MPIYKRKYKSYDKYLSHQREKLDTKIEHFLAKFDKRVESFKERFRDISPKIPGPKVLCLAARLGEEVMAFRQLGHVDSIGVDLNPGPDNDVVIEADFHNLPFDDSQFDGVYCNCLDHAWDLSRIAAETARVIKPEGVLVLDVPFVQSYKNHDYRKNLKKKNKYEAMMWDSLDDVLQQFDRFEEIYDRIPSNTHKITAFLKMKQGQPL